MFYVPIIAFHVHIQFSVRFEIRGKDLPKRDDHYDMSLCGCVRISVGGSGVNWGWKRGKREGESEKRNQRKSEEEEGCSEARGCV